MKRIMNMDAYRGLSCGSTIARWLSAALLIMLSACGGEVLRDEDPQSARESRSLTVITSGGFAAAYELLAPQFETQTGIELHTEYGSSSGGAPDSIPMRLARGEAADVIILSESSLDRLTLQGAVEPMSRVALVHSKIGMAVRHGASKPDISSEDAFATTLRNATSIGYSASASGTYLSQKLWPEMGIWEEISGKSKRILSERVASVVARGEVEIGFQQISEILPIEGADYAGPIPESLQRVTTFATGITVRAQNREDAQRLIDYLSSKEVASVIASTGLHPLVLEKQ